MSYTALTKAKILLTFISLIRNEKQILATPADTEQMIHEAANWMLIQKIIIVASENMSKLKIKVAFILHLKILTAAKMVKAAVRSCVTVAVSAAPNALSFGIK